MKFMLVHILHDSTSSETIILFEIQLLRGTRQAPSVCEPEQEGGGQICNLSVSPKLWKMFVS